MKNMTPRAVQGEADFAAPMHPHYADFAAARLVGLLLRPVWTAYRL